MKLSLRIASVRNLALTLLVVEALEACNLGSQAAAVVDDPRVVHESAVLSDCRQLAREVQLDAGFDASKAVTDQAFGAYCMCTVDAGLRSTCAGVSTP